MLKFQIAQEMSTYLTARLVMRANTARTMDLLSLMETVIKVTIALEGRTHQDLPHIPAAQGISVPLGAIMRQVVHLVTTSLTGNSTHVISVPLVHTVKLSVGIF